nr:MAG TPA: hypothetical protein [Caudoviricetes sp.]
MWYAFFDLWLNHGYSVSLKTEIVKRKNLKSDIFL